MTPTTILSDKQQAVLWDCLFLSLKEISDVLEHVRENARQAFLYPMVVRRSELIWSQVSDIQGDTLIVRERKRVKGLIGDNSESELSDALRPGQIDCRQP